MVGGDTTSPDSIIILLVIFFGVLATLPFAIVLDLIDAAHRAAAPRPPAPRSRPYAPRSRRLGASARSSATRDGRTSSTRATGHAAALSTPDFARRLGRARGLGRDVREVRADRLDAHRPPAETLTDELANLQSDVRPIAAGGVRGGARSGARRAGRQGLRRVRRRAARRRVDRPDPPRDAAGRARAWWSRSSGPGIDDLVDRDAAVLGLVARQLDRRVDGGAPGRHPRLADELIAGSRPSSTTPTRPPPGCRCGPTAPRTWASRSRPCTATLSTDRLLVMDEVVGRAGLGRRGRRRRAGRAPRARPAAAELDPRPDPQRRPLPRRPAPGQRADRADGTLWLLDFGAVGRLDPLALEGLQGIALGFTLRDPSMLARAVRHLDRRRRHRPAPARARPRAAPGRGRRRGRDEPGRAQRRARRRWTATA